MLRQMLKMGDTGVASRLASGHVVQCCAIAALCEAIVPVLVPLYSLDVSWYHERLPCPHRGQAIAGCH